MLPDAKALQSSSVVVVSVVLLVIGGFLLKSSQADSRPPNQKDCKNIAQVASIMPSHVTAYYGMGGLTHVENIQADLDRTIAQLLSREKSLFSWKGIDFEEILLECQFAWRDEQIALFKRVQKRASYLSPLLEIIQAKFPTMPASEAGQWLGEGIHAAEIHEWQRKGLTPFAASLEKMRMKTIK